MLPLICVQGSAAVGWDAYPDSHQPLQYGYDDMNQQHYERRDTAVSSLNMDEIDVRLANIETRRAQFAGNYGNADNSRRRSRPQYDEDELLPKRSRNF
jgi:hypothetical protein